MTIPGVIMSGDILDNKTLINGMSAFVKNSKQDRTL